jgi:hypothetical protein
MLCEYTSIMIRKQKAESAVDKTYIAYSQVLTRIGMTSLKRLRRYIRPHLLRTTISHYKVFWARNAILLFILIHWISHSVMFFQSLYLIGFPLLFLWDVHVI